MEKMKFCSPVYDLKNKSCYSIFTEKKLNEKINK